MMIKPCPFCGETEVMVNLVRIVVIERHFTDRGNAFNDFDSPEKPRPVSDVLCSHCASVRHDLCYDAFSDRVFDAHASEVPPWYAAMFQYDKEARAE